MPSEWQETTLGEVATVRSGFAFKSSDWVEEGVPVVKVSNVKDGRLVLDGCSYVTPEVAAEADEYRLRAGDILVAMTGYIGDVALVRDDSHIMLNQRVGRFEVKRAGLLDPLFLFYFLRLPGTRSELEGRGYGSAQPNISPDLIHAIEMPLPPLREQRSIARVLGALDDKIELNRKMNETLEQMARAVFKARFTYPFEGLPMLMAGKPPSSFPLPMGEGGRRSGEGHVELVDSELGKIPKGWTVHRLGDVTQRITKGTTPTTLGRSFADHGIRFVKVESITDDGRFDMGRFAYIDEETNRLLARSVLQENDVLFTIAGTIGRVASVTRPVLPANTNQAVAIIRCDSSRVAPVLVRYLMAGRGAQALLTARVVQAVQANLSLAMLSDFRLALPDINSQRRFAEPIQALVEKIDATEVQSRTLAAIRDALLPKLMSGEVRVNEVA